MKKSMVALCGLGLLILFQTSAVNATNIAAWVEFDLIVRPYHNPETGQILYDISGMRNRPGIDPFEGGGKVYPYYVIDNPDMFTVHHWSEKNISSNLWEETYGYLFLLLEGDESDIFSLETREEALQYLAVPDPYNIYIDYNFSDFNPTVFPKSDAENKLMSFYGTPSWAFDESGYIHDIYQEISAPIYESNPIPAPSTLFLLAPGLLGLVGIRWRWNRRARG